MMVTHDPFAASFADHVVFLSDGSIADCLDAPSAEQVLDRMKEFG
jgi:putative ABC transport system ATP-binding protein